MIQSQRCATLLLVTAAVLAGCSSQPQTADRTCTVGATPTPAAIAHLAYREGDRAVVYTGANGRPTAGVGHVLVGDELKRYPLGARVPERVRAGWIKADTALAWQVASAQAQQIGEPCVTETLFAVVYQLGEYWHTVHKKTWGHLLARDWEKAMAEAENSLWNRQTPLRVGDFKAGLQQL